MESHLSHTWAPRLAVLILAGLPAHAVAGETPEERARELVEAANADLARLEYNKGILGLEAAFALQGDPEILLRIALAYHHWGGHCRETMQGFQRYFRACPQCSSTKAARREFERARKPCQVIVSVRTAPPGATIRIDGKKVGQAPGSWEVAAGHHRVVATLQGHVPCGRVLDAVPGQPADVECELPAAGGEHGFITLHAVPAGAAVSLDGSPVKAPGKAPIKAAPGVHRLEVRAKDRPAVALEARISSGQTTEYDLTALLFTLEPLASSDMELVLAPTGEQPGRILLEAVPRHAQVRLDETPVAEPGAAPLEAPPGTHELEVTAPGLPPIKLAVDVVEGQTIRCDVGALLRAVGGPGEEADEGPAPAPPPPAPAATTGTGLTLPVVTAGFGVAALIAGAVLGVLSNESLEQQEALVTTAPSADHSVKEPILGHNAEARSAAILANVSFGIAGIAAVSTVAVYLFSGQEGGNLPLGVRPGVGSLSVGGAF